MFENSIITEGWYGPLLLWSGCYLSLLVIYFSMGLLVEILARRNPQRRIQNRDPSDRWTDIRLSVVSLISISGYLAGGVYLQATGWALFNIGSSSWWVLIATFVLSLVVYDAWFYWFHRLMHTRMFYPIHARHHVSIAPRAWSCNNDSFLGSFFEQAYFLVAPLVLPIPAIVIVVHKVWDQIACAFGHGGYEFFAGPLARSPWPGVSTTYHDQHHSHFKCNYANTFTFWDRVMGTLHPSYDEKVIEFEKLASSKDN